MYVGTMPKSPSNSRAASGARGEAHRPTRGSTGAQPGRPCTLIACGLLGLLPLHAASYQRGQEIRCLLSDYAVAYAPSARVLDATRLGQAQAGTGPRVSLLLQEACL